MYRNDEPPDEWPSYTEISRTQHTANKEHKCRHCGRMIKKGERYWKTVGLFDGVFFSDATHGLNADCIYYDG